MVTVTTTFDWWREDDNEHWALFNGMLGCYYGFYNDGDDATGAIDNNRVHGFRTVKSFKELAERLDAKAVECYLKYGSEKDLEKAMDEAICIAWRQEQEKE